MDRFLKARNVERVFGEREGVLERRLCVVRVDRSVDGRRAYGFPR